MFIADTVTRDMKSAVRLSGDVIQLRASLATILIGAGRINLVA
jgi:hypothetical protein